MHVVQASAWYPPHDLGGTEVYLEALVEELGALGVGTTLLVPRRRHAPDRYEHRGKTVATYPVDEQPTRRDLRQHTPHMGFDAFSRLLAQERGTSRIYHQHAWTRGCGPDHLACARALGFRTVLTVHVPTVVCLRGTMMRSAGTACDGLVQASRCGGCHLESRGMPASVARTIAALPQAVADRGRHVAGRAGTVISARALGAAKQHELRAMFANADTIVAVCQWLYDALALNGVPTDKLRLSRQGLPRSLVDQLARSSAAGKRSEDAAALRILLLGRWDAVKGIDLLVRAAKMLPLETAVHVTIHAVASNSDGLAYERHVRALADGDPRITIAGAVRRSDIATAFGRHDVLAIPSQWLETGPLVALEAQAAGLHIVGSRLGGIAELVEGTGTGMLVDAATPEAWAYAIRSLADRHRAGDLVRRPMRVRGMEAVARDMLEIYRSL